MKTNAMKKLLFIASLFCIYQTKAQITFPAAGATWHYIIYNQNQTLQYTHDSLFMGKTTKVIENPYCFYNCGGTQQQSKTLIYTSNDSVFFHNPYTKNQWELLYSFNTPVGQSWRVLLKDSVLAFPPIPITDTITFTVDSSKVVTINSMSLKKLCVTYTVKTSQGNTIMGFNNQTTIYDRIGASVYLLPFHSSVMATDCYDPYLICYNDNTLGLYKADTTSCNYIPSGITSYNKKKSTQNIYPNPAQNKITIDANDVVDVKLFDVLGKQIFTTKDNQLDVSNFTNGVYFIQVQTNTSTTTQKIMVQH
jgi:hypothetical protein